MTQNILIYGYFGWYNAGDDAIGYGLLKEISNYNQSIEITLTSNKIYFEKQAKMHIPEVKIKTINFHFLSLFKELLKTDKFIIAGGTQFTDEDQFILRRTKIFVYFYVLTLFANIISKPPILLGHGIGPITKSWNMFFLKKILKNSKFIMVRDHDSFDFVKSLGFSEKCILGFDCCIAFIKSLDDYSQNTKNIVGLSILPSYSIYSKNPSLDTNIIISLGESMQKIMREFPSLHLRLFSFRSGERHSDESIVLELRTYLDNYSDRLEIVNYNGDILEFLLKINECKIFVGMRYHSSLFAYLLAKPLIIIDYMGKCRSLAKDIHQNNEYILSMNDILLDPEGNILFTRLKKLMINREFGYLKLPIINTIDRQRTMFSLLEYYLK